MMNIAVDMVMVLLMTHRHNGRLYNVHLRVFVETAKSVQFSMGLLLGEICPLPLKYPHSDLFLKPFKTFHSSIHSFSYTVKSNLLHFRTVFKQS